VRHRLAALVLWLGVACAATTKLPESGAEPVADAPPPAADRTDGRADGPAPRWIEFRLATPAGGTTWGAYCRVGVWTPIDERAATRFVQDETWSRLGDREPRRMQREFGAVWSGPLARVRPTADGAIDFVVEVSEGRVDEGEPRTWHGATVPLPLPFQRTYRFTGRAPAGHAGPIARWGGLLVSLSDPESDASAADSPRRTFNHGFVCGPDAEAEYETIAWKPKEPVERSFDGVLQARFRLAPERSAAGFRADKTYGEGVTLDG